MTTPGVNSRFTGSAVRRNVLHPSSMIQGRPPALGVITGTPTPACRAGGASPGNAAWARVFLSRPSSAAPPATIAGVDSIIFLREIMAHLHVSRVDDFE